MATSKQFRRSVNPESSKRGIPVAGLRGVRRVSFASGESSIRQNRNDREAAKTRSEWDAMTGPILKISRLALLTVVLAGIVGCTGSDPQHRREDRSAKSKPSTQPAVVSPTEGEWFQPCEFWYRTRLFGKDVGWEHTHIEPVRRDGTRELVVRFESVTRLQRAGTPIESRLTGHCRETPDGRLIAFEITMAQGESVMRTAGRRVGDRLIVTTGDGDQGRTMEIPCDPSVRGFFAVQGELLRRPMQPGERRSFQAFLPGLFQVGKVELTMPKGEANRRVESVTTLSDGGRLASELWIDKRGIIQRQEIPNLGLASILTTREVAEADTVGTLPDLITDVAIPVNRPAKELRRAKRVVYRIRARRRPPAEIFPISAVQRVEIVDDETIRLIVAVPGDEIAAAQEPSRASTAASRWVEADDPAIVECAEQIGKEHATPTERVRAILDFTASAIEDKDYTVGFASAKEVLASRRGDCTEHAVLAAALARALGIPARAVIGLVYHRGSFCFHMWNEFYIDGRWIEGDATQRAFPVGVDHIRITQSDLAGVDALGALLPALEVIGDLSIEIVDVE
ncbi:MAG: transglutaminase domain-containing protein [Planctomycetota bacterium]|nr:MAG: transglutaminase domain-containing protein [Planctomycetota bacterium]